VQRLQISSAPSRSPANNLKTASKALKFLVSAGFLLIAS